MLIGVIGTQCSECGVLLQDRGFQLRSAIMPGLHSLRRMRPLLWKACQLLGVDPSFFNAP